MGKASRMRQERQEHRAAVIAAYERIARIIFPRHFEPDCCINATRVCVEVMKHFDVPVAPKVVGFTVMNRIWKEKMLEHGGWPGSKERSDEWAAEGAHAGSIGGEETENGWPHHLVAVGCGTLIDSSSGQASRPHLGITIPFSIAVPYKEWPVIYETVDGGMAIYYERNGVPFEHNGGWQFDAWNARIAAEITVAIEHQLRRS